MGMSKERNTSMPLLYIFQPQITVNESNMQSRYSFKVYEKETEKDTEESTEESVVQEAEISEDESSMNSADDSMAEKEIEEIPAEIEETFVPYEMDGPEILQNDLPELDLPKLEEESQDESQDESQENSEEIKVVSAAVEEQNSKKKADPQLVNMFLKTLMPKADEELIKNIQEGNLESLQEAEESKPKSETKNSKTVDVQADNEIKKVISRLARYPNVMKRPMCEAEIGGKKQKFQVESKRGDLVKIKTGKQYYQYAISEFKDFRII